MSKSGCTLFIFRRDLRIIDNKGLSNAMKLYENIIPIFILTPEQIINNEYRSDNAVQFMIDSIIDLNKELNKNNSKLHLFYGDNIKVITKIIKKLDSTNKKLIRIAYNIDYTPYSIKRDKLINKLCVKHNLECIETEDYLLSNMGNFNKDDGYPYLVFTPFKNNALKYKIDSINKSKANNLIKSSNIDSISDTRKNLYTITKLKTNNGNRLEGGRTNGLKMLNKIKNQSKYNKTRNTPSVNTTMLSSYIKFGCISIREVYWKIRDTLGIKNELVSQLFWREFYYYITYYFPRTLKGKNYNTKFDGIKWPYNKKYLERWKTGTTGYPIIDSGMRQLNETGFMHNRMRLITSNFLNRILGLDWRLGEKYYATKLTDYDPSVNNGNWQWIASTGVDTKPYGQRIFNPWTQSVKYDLECAYIKQWLPNLKNIPNKHIHQWYKYNVEYNLDEIDYYEPIVEYKEQRQKSLIMYKKGYSN